MQLLSPGRALYTPAEIGTKTLSMLFKLAFIHRSANYKGTPFFPIPRSKKLMSNPEHLSIFAQLLLSNDSLVVETAAILLTSLIEFNIHANNKLYLSGAFYFACRYSGNNFVPLAKLFEVSVFYANPHRLLSLVSCLLLYTVRGLFIDLICCYLSLVICYLLSVTCYLSLVICYLLFVTCHLLFVTCYLLLVICYLLFITCYLLRVICYLLFVICCPHSVENFFMSFIEDCFMIFVPPFTI